MSLPVNTQVKIAQFDKNEVAYQVTFAAHWKNPYNNVQTSKSMTRNIAIDENDSRTREDIINLAWIQVQDDVTAWAESMQSTIHPDQVILGQNFVPRS